MIYIYFVCLASACEILAIHRETHKVLLVGVSSECSNLIKKRKVILNNNIVKICFIYLYAIRKIYSGCNLTGKLSLTSHKRSVLSVDAEASSLLDKNFT